MFLMRRKTSDSWLDPECAGLLGWKLGKRLWTRCLDEQGRCREGRFITLTYDRSRYVDAQDCFDRARAEKHVARFMRKLGQLLGVSLNGKWLCKLEFQAGGWVHWHIVLLDVGKIPKDKFFQIQNVWGHGFVKVKALEEKTAKYLTKYVAKDGNIPGWLYDYPPRSIKVVRTSQGFWNDEQARLARERKAARKVDQQECGQDVSTSGEKPDQEYYVPIGERIEQEWGGLRTFLFRVGDRCFSKVVDHHLFMKSVRKFCRLPKVDGPWREYEEGEHVLAQVFADYEESTAIESQRPGSGDSRAGEQAFSWRPLNLIGTGNRAGWRGVWCEELREYLWVSPKDLAGPLHRWWLENAPWWLKLDWEQDARYSIGEDMYGNPLPGSIVSTVA